MTPMMKQYFDIKKNYSHCLVLYRLGDFYEMFFEDAIIASRELGLTLTGRDWGEEERAPMCGVPFHSIDGYIKKLVDNGHKVALCEQVETPKEAGKNIVKRDVVRVITPGTVIDTNSIDGQSNNYIMSIFQNMLGFGVAVCDVTTGDFICTSVNSVNLKKLIDQIARYTPVEIIVNDYFSYKDEVLKIFDISTYFYSNWSFDYQNAENKLCKHFKVHNLKGFGLTDNVLEICACGGLMEYLYDTQKNSLNHISKLKKDLTTDFMLLDISSRRNLELTETIRERTKKGSLYWVINETVTSSGSRLLKKFIEQPLINKKKIEDRLDAVEELKSKYTEREELREHFKTILDVERILCKIVYGTSNGRDVIALKKSIKNLPEIKKIINKLNGDLIKEANSKIELHSSLYELLENSIQEEPPLTIKEGGLIKDGFDTQLDSYRDAKNNGTEWLLKIESEEREKTGIKNLKIKFNKIFGYYIEVTNSYLKLVPENYIRRQTMANCERYITEELKEVENKILEAEGKIGEIEYEIFKMVVDKISQELEKLQLTMEQISLLDVMSSLAVVAEKYNYTKPTISDNGDFDIIDGRHPVVERISTETFIPNDTYLDLRDDRLSIITGPNMAGKSTYMRQVALISILAQIGSFVPCGSCSISIVDQIFTRVGASDDLASGASTFMVEMNEVANILHNATKDSLIILDEIGRGTSTFDGLSLAWSILEYIAEPSNIGAKTLFATHYHELTELEGNIEGVNNYSITVAEKGEDIIFLRKISKGCIDHSYGIHVAKLAGIPEDVIKRAKVILRALESTNTKEGVAPNSTDIPYDDEYDFEESKRLRRIAKELKTVDVDALTPRQALNMLYTLKNEANN